MGNCLAMGHAVGAAAGLSIAARMKDVRNLPVQKLRAVLREQGAILDGVY
jgi:cytidylate kinase